MERKYKYFMLCRDLAKTTPFLRADGSPVVTTEVNEREAWNKLKGLLEARLVTQDYLCEVELVPVKKGETTDAAENDNVSSDTNLELDTALEGLKNVLRDQGRLSNKNFL